jgi:putative membrane protein insertion efficiency factor
VTVLLPTVPEGVPSEPMALPVGRRLAMAAVRGYQLLRAGRPSPCRYVPSCSEYALESLERHGLARGTWLAVKRVGRCRPFGGRGADPVPD